MALGALLHPSERDLHEPGNRLEGGPNLLVARHLGLGPAEPTEGGAAPVRAGRPFPGLPRPAADGADRLR